MRLAAVGVSHHTASLELRERLVPDPGSVPALLRQLREARLAREVVLLSTCNRVELYAVPTAQGSAERVATWLAETGGLSRRGEGSPVYHYESEAALRHLFRVASSLDSLVIGEPQILGQVKEAYRVAAEQHAAGPVLHRVMRGALETGKRVRTETDIGREAVSVGRAGVELARQVLGELEGRSALLVGAGEHGKLVARALVSAGLEELVVANRTFDRAVALAGRFGASAVHLDRIGPTLERVDIVMTSTAAGRVLLSRAELSPWMRRRRHRPLVMIDLSVPRNIALDVGELEEVYRFDIDDLRQLAERGLASRRGALQEAERIVESEVARCWSSLLADDLNRRIGAAARRAEAIRLAELERTRQRLEHLDPATREAIDAMTRALVKKLLHHPFANARALSGQGRIETADALLAALGAPQNRAAQEDEDG